MTRAIRIDQFGGPEVIDWRGVEVPDPGPGEVRLSQTAIGVNFIDTYHRSGLYPLDLPSGLGCEAAGIIEKMGADCGDLQTGDRVAYVGLPPGAYAEARVVDAERLICLPDSIDDRTAAASMLKGLTAWNLLFRSYRLRPGDVVLIYAAAGGVGSLLAQWAAVLGARVIGVVSSSEKARLAGENGCAEVIRADDPDFVARVRDLSGGAGVAAVYDSIGNETFFQSLDCLRKHGTMVSFGNASGAVEPFSPMELARRGSLFLTRPLVFDFLSTREDLLAATQALFEVLQSGDVKVAVNQSWPLAAAADAHRALESRTTTGSTILLP